MIGRRLPASLAVAIALALVPHGASAWSCGTSSLAALAPTADTIFIGVLTATGTRQVREPDVPGWFPRSLPAWVPRPTVEGKVAYLSGTGNFRVATRYRGTLKRDVTLDIGPDFPNSNGIGQSFVVFANTYHGVMSTGPCSGTFQGSHMPAELNLRPQFPAVNDDGQHAASDSLGAHAAKAAGIVALVVVVVAGAWLLVSRRRAHHRELA